MNRYKIQLSRGRRSEAFPVAESVDGDLIHACHIDWMLASEVDAEFENSNKFAQDQENTIGELRAELARSDERERELRAKVLEARSGAWKFYADRELLRKLHKTAKSGIRASKLLQHYAALIRDNKPGWWQR